MATNYTYSCDICTAEISTGEQPFKGTLGVLGFIQVFDLCFKCAESMTFLKLHRYFMNKIFPAKEAQ